MGSWPAFLVRLPRDEVLVTWQWPGQSWGLRPWLAVTDDFGEPAFHMYRGGAK